ncbi:MAG TPA: hypothetical protein VGP88_03345 [Thermoplasmata archaeon]|nr:hypothetical protein [Thermoplasmata archaeon]
MRRDPSPPRPVRPAPLERAERRTRALEEPLDVRPEPGPPGVLTLAVRNLRRQSHYTVYVPSYPDRTGVFCGCVDFARRDLGTCKHLEAAFLWLADHPGERRAAPPLGAAPIWGAIDRRARHLPTGGPASGKIRYVGGALVE